MANTRSAEKRNRQMEVRRARNRAAKSEMKTQIKKMRATLDEGDEKAIRQTLAETTSVIDRTARKVIIDKNTASRYKARLARAAKRATTSS